jgi:DNA-binding response OmpR family regulator
MMTKEVPMPRGCILVVEDDPAIATVVAETLTAEAYEVVCTGAASVNSGER